MADEAYTVARGAAFVQAIRAGADLYGLDELAVVANAMREGIGGGIGYNGSRYGPFQIKQYEIPVPALVKAGPNSAAAQAWAWSATGIEYVEGKMSTAGAQGKHGHLAVAAIVNGYYDKDNPASVISERVGVYDDLLKRGDKVWTYIAGLADGPQLLQTLTTRVAPGVEVGPPLRPPHFYVHANASWKHFLGVCARNVPASAFHLRTVARRLPRSIL